MVYEDYNDMPGPLAASAPIFSKLEILKLNDIFIFQISRFIRNCLNSNIISNFHTISNYQITHNIISTNSLLIPIARTTNYGLKLTKVIGSKIWNSFNDFYTKLEGSVNRHAKLKKLLPKEVKMKNKPWLSADILKLLKVRNKVFVRKKRQSNNENCTRLYNLLRNRVKEGKKSKNNIMMDSLRAILIPHTQKHGMVFRKL